VGQSPPGSSFTDEIDIPRYFTISSKILVKSVLYGLEWYYIDQQWIGLNSKEFGPLKYVVRCLYGENLIGKGELTLCTPQVPQWRLVITIGSGNFIPISWYQQKNDIIYYKKNYIK
jgi:hypothetical protein